METPKLKLCPFCGCEAWLHEHGGVLSDAPVGYRVECEGQCHAMTCYWHTKEEAISAWERRAPTPESARIAQLEEVLRHISVGCEQHFLRHMPKTGNQGHAKNLIHRINEMCKEVLIDEPV